jgi:hypothetical protein
MIQLSNRVLSHCMESVSEHLGKFYLNFFYIFTYLLDYFIPVLRIHDILVWIRIFGSIPMTTRYLIRILIWNRIRKLFLQALFQSSQRSYEKRQGTGSGTGSGSIPLTN